MNLGLIILLGVAISVGGFLNIRSLIRKWRANPDKWFDLLVGVVITLAAIVLLVHSILKNYIL